VNDVDKTLAEAICGLGDEICGLGARLDQLEAYRRDLLTPAANIPAIEGLSDDDFAHD